jgi:hypothetical protein
MATFVPYSTEEELYLELSRSFNKLRTKGKEPDETFVEECTKLINTPGHSLELFNKLADEHQVLFAEASSQGKPNIFSLDNVIYRNRVVFFACFATIDQI